MPNIISLTIQGAPEEDGHVRLSDFLRELQLLASSLKKLDASLAGSKTALSTYRVVGLSHGSPANVILEARPRKMKDGLEGPADVQDKVLARYFEIINHIEEEGVLPPGAPEAVEEFLADVRSLADPVGKTLAKAHIESAGRRVDLGPRLVSQIARALAPDESSPGFVRGKLEWINIHASANTFHIYPDIGPYKVTCRFSSELRESVLAGVDRFVEVRGILQYRAHAAYAHLIDVQGIDVLEEDSPSGLSDLFGIAPDLTRGLPIGEFLDSTNAEG